MLCTWLLTVCVAMCNRWAISLLLNPSPMRSITCRSRLVRRTASMTARGPRPAVCLAIWEKRDSVIGGGSTLLPPATARIVSTKSVGVASFKMKPETPAFTSATTSSCTGKRSIVMIRRSGAVRFSTRVVRELKRTAPDLRIIAIDLFPVHEDVVALVKAGVSGFILKDATPTDFVDTIRAVAGGSNVLPPPMTESLFSQIARQTAGRGPRAVIDAVRLTKRERQVIDLIGEGLSNKEIAQRLHIATHTVKSHVHNILEKLALHTRLQIAAFARAEGAD